MKRGDYLFAVMGLLGIVSLVYDILNCTPGPAMSLQLTGIGITASLILGIIPWLVAHRLKQRANVGILLLVFVAGAWLTLRLFSLFVSGPVGSLFSSLYTIALAIGYWGYGRRLFHYTD